MKSARSYSLWIALTVVLFVSLLLSIEELDLFKRPIIKYLVLAAAGVPGIFLIVRFLFIRFVISRIDPVFKTIHSSTISQKLIRDKIVKGNVVDDLKQEVKVRADYESEEIRKLRQMEKYRNDFLGNVSHELKTPIFNIQGYILTLLDGGMEDTSINTLYLKRAERSINRLINIVEDLDSMARLELGEFKLKIEIFNLVKVVEEVIEYQEMQARHKNIKINFDGKFSKTVKVKADRKRIMEVLENLIGNTIKYGKEGGKTTIGIKDTGENILVNITDNGIGIEERNLPRIFERFYREDKSRSRESGGTGLGLSIVKHIIQAHNQTITVRSRVGQGTTFIFSLDKA
ncbi:MAG: sensor histidine kinase [Bacteroidia bacterium]|nr:MAG: sensor histidine kinase [Bacteroidia bacterium]